MIARRSLCGPATRTLERFTLPGAAGGLEIVLGPDAEGAPARWLLGDAGPERALDGCSAALLAAARGGALPDGEHGGLVWRPGARPRPLDELGERPLAAVQTNASYVVGEQVIVKWYRRLHPGVHPEAEALAALDAASFAGIAPVHGVLEYRPRDGPAVVLAVAQHYLPGTWNGADAVHRWLDYADTRRIVVWCGEIGALLARVHGALAQAFGARELAPGEIERRRALAVARVESSAARAGSATLRRAAPRVLASLVDCELPAPVAVGRLHGDAHPGQFLTGLCGNRIIDFEGDPLRSLAERREADVTLRDLAALRRGLANVEAWRVLHGSSSPSGWLVAARQAALDGYRTAAERHQAALAADVAERWLDALELEKACAEVLYAAVFAPEWTPVAELALDRLVESSAG